MNTVIREDPETIRDVEGSTFEALVLHVAGPVVVEFMSYGCAHCRILEPVLEQVAQSLIPAHRFFRVNVGIERDLGDRYAIGGTPTLVFFRDGEELGRIRRPAARLRDNTSRRNGRVPMLTTLLYDGNCAVCRSIGGWVQRSAACGPDGASILARAIGDDPKALHVLNPKLDIWDAYATIHVVMPDGTMKTGGEAVAEVLRSLPNTRWFAWTFALRRFGIRPFQDALDVAYIVLADVRPLFGCESCGTSNVFVRTLKPFVDLVRVLAGGASIIARVMWHDRPKRPGYTGSGRAPLRPER